MVRKFSLIFSLIDFYKFPKGMLEDRAAYAINLVLKAIKNMMVRHSYQQLTNTKNKLKGSKFEKAINEEQHLYFCDIDTAISP